MPVRIAERLHLHQCFLGLLGPALGLVLLGCAAEPITKATRGNALFASCAECHGRWGEGNGATMAPRLAGREDWFLQRQMEEFQSRERGKDDSRETGYLPPQERTQYMHPVVARLTPVEIKAILQHIATLPSAPVPPAQQGDVARGRELYAGCIQCHGKRAEGDRRRGAPRLTGQHDWSLFNQLRDFRMGWRGADSQDPHVKLMRTLLDLNDDSLHDLTAYLVSLNEQAGH